MLYTVLISGALIAVFIVKVLLKSTERCPDCGEKREDDHPICECGWVFEYPDDDEPMEYGDPDETP